MPYDESLHAAEYSDLHHLAPDELVELIHNQVSHSISPMAVDINCPQMLAWAKQCGTAKFRFQHLIKELKAWRPFFDKRPISLIWLHRPFKIMDAPGITELIFAIGHNLKLVSGQHVEHLVTLEADEITRENIALLRGLTFNHVNIAVPQGFELAKLKQLINRIREFQIPYVSIEMTFDCTNDDALPSMMNLLRYIQPETLNFPKPPQILCNMPPQEATSVLMQMGYYAHSNQCLMRFRSPLHSRPKDVLHLGPGAESLFGNLHAFNASDPQTYFEQTQKTTLPVVSYR